MELFTGRRSDIRFHRRQGSAVIYAVDPRPEAYLTPGFARLVSDVHALLAELRRSGVTEITAEPDRSATRMTLEEAGFRGEGVMRYAPEEPQTAPVLDAGRPGGFGPLAPVLLESGETVPAGALTPGVRIMEGGRVEEVMTARVRRVCRLGGQIYGSLNRVRRGRGAVLITDLPDAALIETAGTELTWLVTERSRVRSGAHLFEDMWGCASLRRTRQISQAEVIAALNAAEARDDHEPRS